MSSTAVEDPTDPPIYAFRLFAASKTASKTTSNDPTASDSVPQTPNDAPPTSTEDVIQHISLNPETATTLPSTNPRFRSSKPQSYYLNPIPSAERKAQFSAAAVDTREVLHRAKRRCPGLEHSWRITHLPRDADARVRRAERTRAYSKPARSSAAREAKPAKRRLTRFGVSEAGTMVADRGRGRLTGEDKGDGMLDGGEEEGLSEPDQEPEQEPEHESEQEQDQHVPSGDLSATAAERTRKRGRKGKKARIKVRIRFREQKAANAAQRQKEEGEKRERDAQKKEKEKQNQEKEKHLAEKRRLVNRRKQVKKREKKRIEKGEDGGTGDGSPRVREHDAPKKSQAEDNAADEGDEAERDMVNEHD